jgi:transposase
MRHKDGTSKPSYNHQSAVDEKCGVTTAVRTTLSGDQPSDLSKIVDGSVANTGEHHAKVTADSGFSSYDVLEQIADRSEDFYVPDRRFAESKRDAEEKKRYGVEDFPADENGVRHCPAGHAMRYDGQTTGPSGATLDRFSGTACAECPRKARCTTTQKRTVHIDTRDGLRQAMREKLRSDEGRETYMKRQGVIESPHGDDQKNHGWRQHLLRGYRKASAEFMLIRLVRNIGKIIEFGRLELLQT